MRDDVLSIEELVLGTHYTRTCRICGVHWLQSRASEASKDLCSQACQDEADHQDAEAWPDGTSHRDYVAERWSVGYD